MTTQANPLLLICALTTVLTGCGSGKEQPLTGSRVTVQFRRDALGSGQVPVPPTTDVMNGAQVSLSGTLSKVNSQWFVVKYKGKDHWIPRAVVLLIRAE